MPEPVPFYSRDGLNVASYDGRTASWAEEFGDVAYYEDEAARAGGPVLELACGTGRVTWALAVAGHDVTGVDLSPAMLRRCEAKRSLHPAEVGARVHLIEADMCALDLERRFALCLIPFRAFQGLIDPADQHRCLAGALRHLEPGGRLIVDLFDPILEWCTPANVAPSARVSAANPDTGNRIDVRVTARTNDPLHQLFEETWSFIEIGGDGDAVREEHETLTMRWTYRQEMRYLLERTGFEVEAEYSDFQRSPPAYGAEQIWVARRPNGPA